MIETVSPSRSKWTSLPLSCVRNFSSSYDIEPETSITTTWFVGLGLGAAGVLATGAVSETRYRSDALL